MKFQLWDRIWSHNLQPLQDNSNGHKRVRLWGDIAFSFPIIWFVVLKSSSLFHIFSQVTSYHQHENPSFQTWSGAFTTTNPMLKQYPAGVHELKVRQCASQFIQFIFTSIWCFFQLKWLLPLHEHQIPSPWLIPSYHLHPLHSKNYGNKGLWIACIVLLLILLFF